MLWVKLGGVHYHAQKEAYRFGNHTLTENTWNLLNSVYNTATSGQGCPDELRVSMDANKQWLRTVSKCKSELLQIPYS